MNFGRPVGGSMYQAVKKINGVWAWVGSAYYSHEAVVDWLLRNYPQEPIKNFTIIVMTDKANGQKYLDEFLNASVTYEPTPKELDHWKFLRWLVVKGRSFQDDLHHEFPPMPSDFLDRAAERRRLIEEEH